MSYSARSVLTKWLRRGTRVKELRPCLLGCGPTVCDEGASAGNARRYSSHAVKDPVDPYVLGQEVLRRSEYLARLTGQLRREYNELVLSFNRNIHLGLQTRR